MAQTIRERLRNIRDRTVLPRPSFPTTQFWSFVVGTGSALVAMALAFAWFRGFGFPFDAITPLAIGTALAYLAIPVVLTFGIHEAAHWVAATYYADYDRVFFTTTKRTLIGNFASILWIGGLITAELLGVDIVAGITNLLGFLSPQLVRGLLIIGLSISPGAVFILGRNGMVKRMDEVAIVGPLSTFLLGLILFADFGWTLPSVTWNAFWPTTTALTMYLAFLLAVMNALPVPPLDGYHALKQRDVDTMIIQATIIIGTLAILL